MVSSGKIVLAADTLQTEYLDREEDRYETGYVSPWKQNKMSRFLGMVMMLLSLLPG